MFTSGSYGAIEGADVPSSRGLRRKPDESRPDLINRNGLFRGIPGECSRGPGDGAVLIVVSNPVDADGLARRSSTAARAHHRPRNLWTRRVSARSLPGIWGGDPLVSTLMLGEIRQRAGLVVSDGGRVPIASHPRF